MSIVSIKFHNKLVGNQKIRIIYVTAAFMITYFASWLPDFNNVFGIEGARISSVAAFGPLNGMLLGPYWGATVSFFGILAHVLTRDISNIDAFSMVTPIFVMLSSIVAGLIVSKREKIALAIYSSLIILWYAFDVGRDAYYFPWFHIVALVLFVTFNVKCNDKIKNANVYTLVFLFLTSIVAILTDQLAGSISALVIFDLPAEMFKSVVYIYPIERITLAFISALIMFMLTLFLHNILAESEEIDHEIEHIKTDILLDYAINDVKPLLEREKK